jgi:hypothetical protein
MQDRGSVLAKKDDMVSRGLAYGRRQFFVVSCEDLELSARWNISLLPNSSLTAYINTLMYWFVLVYCIIH